MRALLLLVQFTFHLPSFNSDSLCTESLTPCTDLESAYVYQQVRHQQPRILFRTYQRGQEGRPKLFNAPDGVEAVYWVETADTHGNRASCSPMMVQVGGAVSVPLAMPPLVTPEKWYDLAGRRIQPSQSGKYWSTRRRVTVIR